MRTRLSASGPDLTSAGYTQVYIERAAVLGAGSDSFVDFEMQALGVAENTGAALIIQHLIVDFPPLS